jgi:hypothetical protein
MTALGRQHDDPEESAALFADDEDDFDADPDDDEFGDEDDDEDEDDESAEDPETWQVSGAAGITGMR